MAQSPTHRFGQIIGDLLEAALYPILKKFADESGLYLDHKGKRPCRSGIKCTWLDSNGNKHDLDYVLEMGGTPESFGTPVAFIEIAWRRYTKHSRNKVQEIQGAIEPLAEKYHQSLPFKGAVLAGEFTSGALDQLRSLGFNIVHFPYPAVVGAFREVGIDAATDESTPDEVVLRRLRQWERLSKRRKGRVADTLLATRETELKEFLDALTQSVSRKIEEVIVLPLHGSRLRATSIAVAKALLEDYEESVPQARFERYEVHIRFRNTNEIVGRFNDKASAIEFLETYENETRPSRHQVSNVGGSY